MNNIIISGNITKDVMERQIKGSDDKFYAFTVAHNFSKDKVNYYDCLAKGKVGEALKDLKKGDKVVVSGSFNFGLEEYKNEKYSFGRISVKEVDFYRKK